MRDITARFNVVLCRASYVLSLKFYILKKGLDGKMKKFENTVKAIILLTISLPATAQEINATKAMNNFAHSHITCAAYFAVSGACLADKDDLKAKIAASFTASIERAKDYGNLIGLSDKAHAARLERSPT
jgi:hypothetical protein